MAPVFSTHTRNKYLHFLPLPNPATSFLSRLLEHLPLQALFVLPEQNEDGSQQLVGLLKGNAFMVPVLLSVHHGQATAGNDYFSTALGTACAVLEGNRGNGLREQDRVLD